MWFALMAERKRFRSLDFTRFAEALASAVVFGGHNLHDPVEHGRPQGEYIYGHRMDSPAG